MIEAIQNGSAIITCELPLAAIPLGVRTQALNESNPFSQFDLPGGWTAECYIIQEACRNRTTFEAYRRSDR